MYNNVYYIFGDVLKIFRKRKHLTQEALAAKLGVHRNTISIWERGDYLPESKTIMLELAHQLDLDEQETRQLLEASLTSLSPRWYLPYPHNPFFTGRGELLDALHRMLSVEQGMMLIQPYVLYGLEGVGKTQTVVEYAYRHMLEYSAIFWIEAESIENIVTSFFAIAELLRLPECQSTNEQQVIMVVQHWLNTHSHWLLIWDNVENIDLLQRFLLPSYRGVSLITSRCQTLGTLAQKLELLPMTPEEGLLLLLRRAKVLGLQASTEQIDHLFQQRPDEYMAARKLVAAMDGLPLALDQVGAYAEEIPCSLVDCWEIYQTRQTDLLKRRGDAVVDHPASVVATWSLSFEKVEQASAAAADLLQVCALLYLDAIPEKIFTRGAAQLGERLAKASSDPFQFNDIIRTASTYSLLKRNVEEHTLSMHPLVKAVLRERMQKQEKDEWTRRVERALDAVFPEGSRMKEHDWTQYECLILQKTET